MASMSIQALLHYQCQWACSLCNSLYTFCFFSLFRTLQTFPQLFFSLNSFLSSLLCSLSLYPLLLLISLQSALLLSIGYYLLLHRKPLSLPHVINVTSSNVTLDVPLCVSSVSVTDIYIYGVMKCGKV
jgi:hypothetical protein